MPKVRSNFNSVEDLSNALSNAQIVENKWGGLKVQILQGEKTLKFSRKQIAKALLQFAEQDKAKSFATYEEAVTKLRNLQTPSGVKRSTKIRQAFGNLFFNRERKLRGLEEELISLPLPACDIDATKLENLKGALARDLKIPLINIDFADTNWPINIWVLLAAMRESPELTQAKELLLECIKGSGLDKEILERAKFKFLIDEPLSTSINPYMVNDVLTSPVWNHNDKALLQITIALVGSELPELRKVEPIGSSGAGAAPSLERFEIFGKIEIPGWDDQDYENFNAALQAEIAKLPQDARYLVFLGAESSPITDEAYDHFVRRNSAAGLKSGLIAIYPKDAKPAFFSGDAIAEPIGNASEGEHAIPWSFRIQGTNKMLGAGLIWTDRFESLVALDNERAKLHGKVEASE